VRDYEKQEFQKQGLPCNNIVAVAFASFSESVENVGLSFGDSAQQLQ
jgi:hypothetical protein